VHATVKLCSKCGYDRSINGNLDHCRPTLETDFVFFCNEVIIPNARTAISSSSFFSSLPELAGSGCDDAISFDLVLLISIHCS